MAETLFEKLKSYGDTDAYPFHMPGHKRRMAPKEIGHLYGMDITEIDGFDNLHDAEGILKDAQDNAAKLYHSDETRFLINGSTGGILAAMAGLCDDGDSILVARNCHKAVYHAIELHHLEPVYIYPHINTKYGINEGIYPLDVEKMWITHQNIRAIVITSPTYDGVVSDVKEICRIAHSHGVPVIVDEAHGAHFIFSDYYPKSALECGADIVIQSTHKTLPAMTQTALIHLNGDLIDRERIRRMLAIYQTSSPSYILMGSIDAGLHMLEEDGGAAYAQHTEELQRLRDAIHECSHIRMPEMSELDSKYAWDYDRSKLVLSVKGTSMTGPQLHERLLNQYHLQMEMVSADYVLAMTGVGDSWDGYERLIHALREIDQEIEDQHEAVQAEEMMDTLPQMAHHMSIYDAQRQEKTICELDNLSGCAAGDYIYLYPPGIPLITPGELVTEDVVNCIRRWMDAGLHISGMYEIEGKPAVRILK